MALSGFTRIAGISGLLLLICIVMMTLNPVFVDDLNLTNLTRWTGFFGILALGVAFVIITGGIDLSIGSVVALTGIVLMYLLQEPALNPVLAIAITLLVGVVIGLTHGLLIGYCKMQSFVVTLCGLMAYRGIARWVSDDLTLSLGPGYDSLRYYATGDLFSIPLPLVQKIAFLFNDSWVAVRDTIGLGHVGVVAAEPSQGVQWVTWVALPLPMLILLGLAIIGAVLLHKTVIGRYLLAMGRNEEAARYSGINTRQKTLIAYVICSTLAAMGGILFALYNNTVQPSSMGNFYELYAIAAAVLGGCSLRGGVGSIAGVVIGTAVMRSLYNAINLLDIKTYWEYIIIGGVLLLGVMIDEVGRQVVNRIKTQRRKKMLSDNAGGG